MTSFQAITGINTRFQGHNRAPLSQVRVKDAELILKAHGYELSDRLTPGRAKRITNPFRVFTNPQTGDQFSLPEGRKTGVPIPTLEAIESRLGNSFEALLNNVKARFQSPPQG